MLEDDWLQIKEAFWKAVLDGADGDTAFARADNLDPQACAELKALVDEHASLASHQDTPQTLRDPSNLPLAAISVHLELQRLDASEARQLAQALGASDSALSEAALVQVEEQSAGEPFLIHEIMRWVNLRGSEGALAAPFSLADVLLARTRGIGDDAIRLLQLLVIAGQPIGRSVIQAALPYTSIRQQPRPTAPRAPRPLTAGRGPRDDGDLPRSSAHGAAVADERGGRRRAAS